MALYYNIFRWKRLKAGLHTPVTNTAPFIVTRYPPVILWWQGPSVQLRPYNVPQPVREKAQQEERRTRWKKHMWHVKWEGRERKLELSLSYGKCFSYKSSFLTSPCCFPAYFWNVPYSKSGCSSMSVPSMFKGRYGLIDKQKVEGKDLW